MASADSLNLSSVLSRVTLVYLLIGSLVYLTGRVAYQIIHYRYFHPLSQFPGPFWASVTRLWMGYNSFSRAEASTLNDAYKKYGTVVRASPNLLIVNDPTRLPEIYHRQANKTGFYVSGLFGKTESVFNVREWKPHAHHRKFIAGPFSFTNIKKMEPLVNTRVSDWLDKLDERFAKTGKPVEFSQWAVFMAYDIVSELAFGAPLGFVESGTDVSGLIQAFHNGFPFFAFMIRLHPFTNWIKKTWLGEKFFVARPEHNSDIARVMRFRDKLLAQRLKEIEAGTANAKLDLLQQFLDVRTEEGKPLDLEIIKAEVLLVLLAGVDTTGTAFQAIVHYLILHPAAHSKVMAEVDQATRAGHISAMAQYDEVIRHCPYYVACVKETMRLCPPVEAIMPRLVSKGGMMLDGKFVPEGTELSCISSIVQRNRDIFGDDANEFRPERWLESEEKAKEYNKYSMVFGYGARSCLGKDLALLELYKAPLQFLRTYHVRPVNGKKIGERVDFGGIVYWKDFWLSIERRAPVI